MLYMHIFTWEPDKTDEIIKRSQTLGVKVGEGAKLIGFWDDLHGCRSFMLVDAPAVVEPKLILEAVWPWHDLVKIEVVPVMEYEEMMKLLPKA